MAYNLLRTRTFHAVSSDGFVSSSFDLAVGSVPNSALRSLTLFSRSSILLSISSSRLRLRKLSQFREQQKHRKKKSIHALNWTEIQTLPITSKIQNSRSGFSSTCYPIANYIHASMVTR
jgi:hypothetical protein